MANSTVQSKLKQTPIEEAKLKQNPNEHLYSFLQDNNYKLSVKALNDENPFVGQGFVLTDKPLLVVSAEYKEAHA